MGSAYRPAFESRHQYSSSSLSSQGDNFFDFRKKAWHEEEAIKSERMIQKGRSSPNKYSPSSPLQSATSQPHTDYRRCSSAPAYRTKDSGDDLDESRQMSQRVSKGFTAVFHLPRNHTMRLLAAKRQGELRGPYIPPSSHQFRDLDSPGGFRTHFRTLDRLSIQIEAAREKTDMHRPRSASPYLRSSEDGQSSPTRSPTRERPSSPSKTGSEFRTVFRKLSREEQMGTGKLTTYLGRAQNEAIQSHRLDEKLKKLMNVTERKFVLHFRSLRKTDRQNIAYWSQRASVSQGPQSSDISSPPFYTRPY